MATGAIAVDQSSQLYLGGSVTFDASFDPHLDKKEKGGVRIQVMAYNDAHQLIYAEAGHYDMTFLLGGIMSPWYQSDGPAHLHADLYFWSYPHTGQKLNLLASCDFDATGRP